MTIAFNRVQTGEIAGSTSAAQMPDIDCRMVKFKAVIGNPSNVYIGGAGVTVVDGTADATSGWELDAGEETEWIPVYNLNLLYYICDAAGDDLVYMAIG